MKSIIQHINERLKLSKDTKSLDLSFTKIDINQFKFKDKFYTVDIYI